MPVTSVKALCSLVQRQPYLENLLQTTKVIDDFNKDDTADEHFDIRREQLRDPVIRYWIYHIRKRKFRHKTLSSTSTIQPQQNGH